VRVTFELTAEAWALLERALKGARRRRCGEAHADATAFDDGPPKRKRHQHLIGAPRASLECETSWRPSTSSNDRSNREALSVRPSMPIIR
jgi:hypothetical protein